MASHISWLLSHFSYAYSASLRQLEHSVLARAFLYLKDRFEVYLARVPGPHEALSGRLDKLHCTSGNVPDQTVRKTASIEECKVVPFEIDARLNPTNRRFVAEFVQNLVAADVLAVQEWEHRHCNAERSPDSPASLLRSCE